MTNKSRGKDSLAPVPMSKSAQEKLAKMDLSDGQVAMISLLADVAVARHLKENHDQEEQ